MFQICDTVEGDVVTESRCNQVGLVAMPCGNHPGSIRAADGLSNASNQTSRLIKNVRTGQDRHFRPKNRAQNSDDCRIMQRIAGRAGSAGHIDSEQ